jgi:hypothetical protein
MTKQKDNIYSNKRQAITYSAGRIYTASKGGFPIDSSQQDSTSHYDLGDGSAEDLAKARNADVEFKVAVQKVIHFAGLKDAIDSGGIRSIAARVEYGLTVIFEHQNIKNADPIVDNIRGNHQQ